MPYDVVRVSSIRRLRGPNKRNTDTRSERSCELLQPRMTRRS